MATSSSHNVKSRQPHLYGAQPLHYRQGTALASAESPPCWSPELEADPTYPYSVVEWSKDVRKWQAATKLAAERQGPLLSLALGTAARTVADEIPIHVLQYGAEVDIGDGAGVRRHAGAPALGLSALGPAPRSWVHSWSTMDSA